MIVRVLCISAALMLAGCFEGEKAVDASCGGEADSVAPGTLGAPCYGNKTCNSGLACKSGVCAKAPDLGPPDSGPDTGKPEASVKEGGPVDGGSAYKIMITEIMADSGKANDAIGEWFEVYNLGSDTVNLHGWTISTTKTGGFDKHKINATSSTLNIKPNHYLVFGASDNKKTNDAGPLNGGVPVDYAYTSYKVNLENVKDSLMLTDDKGKLVDRVDYNTATKWPVQKGVSMSLKSVGLDNNVAANWCLETKAWKTSLGDFGSPGAPPECK